VHAAPRRAGRERATLMRKVDVADLDRGKGPEQLGSERLQRVIDAYELRQPDRIPHRLGVGFFTAEFAGLTHRQFVEDPEAAIAAIEKAAVHFATDQFGSWFDGSDVNRILGDRMTKWPGLGLGPDGSFQFDEHEFMTAQDYPAFIADPSDWSVRTYLPRANAALEGLAHLPNLGMWSFGWYNMGSLRAFAKPEVAASLRAIAQAVEASVKWGDAGARLTDRLSALGFPPDLPGFLLEAPFDYMSDTLRGMKGIMLDLRRHPDELLAAEVQAARFQVDFARQAHDDWGAVMATIPLHRGSDGFMSIAQFERFYWPQLRDLMLELIDIGITPRPYYEGVWDQRLEYLADLPRGKTVGMFQSSDIFKVKEIVGDTMCIVGGLPVSMLKDGDPTALREKTHELCERVGAGGGYIMGSSINELEGCRTDLIEAWVQATREFGVY
jgi:hypothetical protein